jgi:hypothetical protein
MTEHKFIWGQKPTNMQKNLGENPNNDVGFKSTKHQDGLINGNGVINSDSISHSALSTLETKEVLISTDSKSPETPNIVKGIVLSVENKTSRKSGHPYFEIFLNDEEGKYFGLKFSGRGISPYNVQDIAEFTYEQNGSYYNIRDYLNRKEVNTQLNDYDKNKFDTMFKDGMLDKLSKSLLLYCALEIVKMKKGEVDEIFVEYKKLEEWLKC